MDRRLSIAVLLTSALIAVLVILGISMRQPQPIETPTHSAHAGDERPRKPTEIWKPPVYEPTPSADVDASEPDATDVPPPAATSKPSRVSDEMRRLAMDMRDYYGGSYPFDDTEGPIPNGLPKLTPSSILESPDYNPNALPPTESRRQMLESVLRHFDVKEASLKSDIRAMREDIISEITELGTYRSYLRHPDSKSLSTDTWKVRDGVALFQRGDAEELRKFDVFETEYPEFFALHRKFYDLNEERAKRIQKLLRARSE